ncbi:hypothetical protein GNZ24_05605 [Burkholderia thailandensis]|nr:hypothetical protein A8H31_15915 [Burkholderia thailandensis]AWY58287.1 hypothetical protein A8H35_07405 [Burkholderia thailandensis]AWY67536.1 hypothetical protein A8H36_20935 [Burkholderia thailandensis]MUV22628.1 hypothetical protein [Burkholderia thailandensis]MUV26525.1 hypothetical protein [Burkholderia thailandensis]
MHSCRTTYLGLPMKSTQILASCALAGAVTALAGCAGSPANGPQAESPNGRIIYVASPRSPRDVESCLTNRVAQARVAQRNPTTVLIGPYSVDSDWTVTLAPSASSGTNIGVYRPRSGDGDPEESELRFHIARCAI